MLSGGLIHRAKGLPSVALYFSSRSGRARFGAELTGQQFVG
ncbi:MAG: hypothetical protein ACI8XU_001259 [Kiritimatiellia bacterium]|jgi:hypothetical protein